MKRFLALIFLVLYAYNIAGYLAIFSVLQYRVRSEIKKMLKATVPEGELITLTFHTESLAGGVYPLQWMEPHEFRYNGSMFDIIESDTTADSIHFVCINDVQEEQLFENLDGHVERHMGDSEAIGKFDSFKDVFKDSYTNRPVLYNFLFRTGTFVERCIDEYASVEPDVPFLPPRLSA